jgi:hypothetical protein
MPWWGMIFRLDASTEQRKADKRRGAENAEETSILGQPSGLVFCGFLAAPLRVLCAFALVGMAFFVGLFHFRTRSNALTSR